MMPNFFLIKFKKFCIFIGPYELAFNEPQDAFFIEEDIEE